MKKSSKSSKINIIDGFGKKRRDVSIVSAYQISEFRGKVSNHYFMINIFSKILILQTMRRFWTKFISCHWRECWNDLLHMKIEEPTSNTDISGKTKNDKTLWKIQYNSF